MGGDSHEKLLCKFVYCKFKDGFSYAMRWLAESKSAIVLSVTIAHGLKPGDHL